MFFLVGREKKIVLCVCVWGEFPLGIVFLWRKTKINVVAKKYIIITIILLKLGEKHKNTIHPNLFFTPGFPRP